HTFTAKFGVNDKGDVLAHGSLDVSGTVKLNQRLEIRDPTGGIDTDVLAIERFNNSPNHNDLRIVIGDDEWGDDRFVVGPIPFGTTTLAPKFVVANTGDATVAGNLHVAGTVKVNDRHEIRE